MELFTFSMMQALHMVDVSFVAMNGSVSGEKPVAQTLDQSLVARNIRGEQQSRQFSGYAAFFFGWTSAR
ncbi:MAG: hypothetical protein H7X89_02185 [Rhizobiales bacterium]|nr:hypothetical protein [Hyphomicrobiales bacterium]